MADTHTELRSRLTELTRRFNLLGASLSNAVRDLLTEGIPPAEAMQREIAAARADFTDAREAVREAARAASLPAAEGGESLQDLQALVERIETQTREWARRHESARALLDGVLGIEYRGRGELAELADCRARARAMRDRVGSAPTAEAMPEIERLLGPEHEFGALLALIQSHEEEVDSETALALSTRVETAFGKRIAVEALRGRLALGDGEPEPPSRLPAPVAREIAPVPPVAPALEEKPDDEPEDEPEEDTWTAAWECAPASLSREEQLARLCQQSGDWLEHAPRLLMKNGLAKRVWLRWVRPGGAIAAFVHPISENDASRLPDIKRAIERLASEQHLEFVARQTAREMLGPDTRMDPLPMNALAAHARTALSFAERWVALQEAANVVSAEPAPPLRQSAAAGATARPELREAPREIRPLPEPPPEPVPEPEEPEFVDEVDHLRAFLPDGLERALRALRDNPLREAADRLLPEAPDEEVARMLQAWEEARRTGRPGIDGLRAIFQFLGFHLDSRSDDQLPNHTGLRGDFVIAMTPQPSGGPAPAAHYGSAARTRFRLLCLADGEPPSEMTTLVKRAASQDPIIALYFGALDEARRAELAQRAAEARAPFLVLDDALLLHLCTLASPRTRAFFRCALPFSYLNPFTPDAPADAEIFQGRRAELAEALAMRGACFVSGSRRAGKTSLLRQAQRRFQRASATGELRQLALYLDLREAAIGIDHPLDDLYFVLCQAFLQAFGKSPDDVGSNEPYQVFTLMREWLDADPERKLLLLFDGADAFLRVDGNAGFWRTARFRGLMEDANYRERIKVVFAGDQDVLRTGRTENHPLAQYGEPIVLGPLAADRQEDPAAARLLESPLAPLGYAFESPATVDRILAETEGHPRSLHLYGHALVERLANAAAESPRALPSVILDSVALDLLDDDELQTRLRAAFQESLDFDPRYRVLARIIAGAGDESPAPLSLEQLRRQALIWWAEGFRESDSLYEIRVLLEEMTTLGLLRRHKEEKDPYPRYALRSERLRAAFGTREELQAALMESHRLKREEEFDAVNSRLGYGSLASRRSPLTMGQLHELRQRATGVTMIFGCQAADLDHLHLFLAHRLEREFTCVNRYATRADFQATLGDLRRKPPGSRVLLLVPSDCAWDETWVADALECVRAFPGKDRYARIAFAADAEKAWHWLRLTEEHKDELRLHDIAPPLPLMPWHNSALCQWLEENGLDVSEDERPAITDVTGNWPVALAKFKQAVGSEPLKWRSHLEALRFTIGEHRADIARAFGLDLPEPSRVMRALARLDRATAAQLTDGTALPREVVDRCLQWADLLGLILPSASARSESIEWRLVPLVGRLLE